MSSDSNPDPDRTTAKLDEKYATIDPEESESAADGGPEDGGWSRTDNVLGFSLVMFLLAIVFGSGIGSSFGKVFAGLFMLASFVGFGILMLLLVLDML